MPNFRRFFDRFRSARRASGAARVLHPDDGWRYGLLLDFGWSDFSRAGCADADFADGFVTAAARIVPDDDVPLAEFPGIYVFVRARSERVGALANLARDEKGRGFSGYVPVADLTFIHFLRLLIPPGSRSPGGAMVRWIYCGGDSRPGARVLASRRARRPAACDGYEFFAAFANSLSS